MVGERQYAAVEVVGRAAGMNQAGWEGAIADNECTTLWNMSTNSDGEWTKRKGYVLLESIVTGSSPATLKLHWHTDESTDQADGTTWVESGDEVTAASSGALDIQSMDSLTAGTLDGESVGGLRTSSVFSYISIKSSFNLDADAGRLTFWFNLNSSYYIAPNSVGTNSLFPFDGSPYIFYGGANFYIKLTPEDGIIWKYGSGASEYIVLGHLYWNKWVKIDIRWDNTVAGNIYPYRFQAYFGGILKYADPAGQVTTSFDADVYFLNDSGKVSSLYKAVGTVSYRGIIALISSWSSSGATPLNTSITGIHNNSSQQRAIITSGVATPAIGQIFYSPSWTQATAAADAIAGTRTAATECQGNIYITDGSHHLFYLIGTGTTTTVYELPETAKWIEEYHGHLCIAGLGTNGAYSVRLSTIDDFTTSSAVSWPATNQVFKCRDVVRGIKAFNGQLIVGTRSTIEGISGYLPADFVKTIIATGASCASHWSMKEVPLMDGTTSALMWAGYDGIYMLMQGQVSKISWPIQDFWDTLSKVEIEEAHAVDCRERGEYMLAVSDGSAAENNYVVVYNYRKGDWAIWKYANKMDVLGKYYRSGKEIILGGDSLGNLYELNRNDSDNGIALNGYILTKWHDGGVPDVDKEFRRMYVWAAPLENHDVEIGWSTDYKEGIVEASVVAGTDGNDYVCVSSHEPSVVVGTDGNDYYCSDAHTSAAATCPTTGANYATVWTAAGTTGRGTTWAADTNYIANDDKKPITGGQYALYWVPKNTIGEGSTWAADAGYSAENISMEKLDSITLDGTSAVFGTAVFGTDIFASGTSTKVFNLDLTEARGKAIRFMFRNQNADEPFKIRGYKAWFTYIPEFPA